MTYSTEAARIIATIVQVRTKQLELRLQAARRDGVLGGERLYRSGELAAALSDLRAELRACEQPGRRRQRPAGTTPPSR